jgi:GAF domain-containing protein
MATPKPPSESARLAALRAYRQLDTPPEQAFDEITALAAQVCGTPISLAVLLDTDRQWFKSRHGLAVQQTSRDIAFCAHAIMTTDVMIVEDAKNDARFADNPLVTGEPHIRFYAGAPLVDPDGHALGTLCVIDRVPRRLAAWQQNALNTLARQVVAQMVLQRVAGLLAGALEALKVHEEFVAICSWCKEVREGSNWKRVEEYLSRLTGANITHGMCPACYERHMRALRELPAGQ